MKRYLPLLLTVCGGLVFVLAAALLVLVQLSVQPEDAAVRKPVARAPLQQFLVGHQQTVVQTVIPDTPQWRRLRRGWGEPFLAIAAIAAGHRDTLCLPELGLHIDVRQNGERLEARPFHPYGYGGTCEGGALYVQPAPAMPLTVTVIANGPLPTGDLLVVWEWPGMKDKLVGLSLTKTFRKVAAIGIAIGLALLLLGRYLRHGNGGSRAAGPG
jgi:hypothetical protein